MIPLFGYWHTLKFVSERLYEFGFQQLFSVVEEAVFGDVPKNIELLHLHYLYTYISLAKQDEEVKRKINELKNNRNLHPECVSWLKSFECIINEIIPTIREYAYAAKLQNFEYYFQLLKRLTLMLLKFHIRDQNIHQLYSFGF